MYRADWYGNFVPALKLGPKLKGFRIDGSSKFFKKKISENIGSRVEKLVLNSVLNFRRVTDFLAKT